MTQRFVHEIDLTKIVGEGDFQCPSCGETISPDDDSGVFYDIIDVQADEDDLLEEVTILCKKCHCVIQLGGFKMLKGMQDEYFKFDDYLLQR